MKALLGSGLVMIMLTLSAPPLARSLNSQHLYRGKPAASQVSLDKSKKPYVSDEGRFSIEFPVAPRESSDVKESPSGQLKIHGATCIDNSIIYGAAYADFPQDLDLLFPSREKLFERFRNFLPSSRLLSNSARVIKEYEFEQIGYMGRFTKIELDGDRLWLMKVLPLKSRVYLVHAVFPKRAPTAAASDDRNEQTAMKFLDSFVVFEEPPANQHRDK
jgi:hypothetical protein